MLDKNPMKKLLKYFLIFLISVFSLGFVAAGIAVWIVFTPAKITPIVRNQAEKFLVCQTEIGEIELTFFSTFPRFGLKAEKVILVNPVANSPSDTLLKVDKVTGVLDLKAFIRNGQILLSDISLLNATVSAFVDAGGKSNFDILTGGNGENDQQDNEFIPGFVDIGNALLKNINILYVDSILKLTAQIRNLDAIISGTVDNDIIEGRFGINSSNISFELDGELYLDDSYITLNIPGRIDQSVKMILIDETVATIDGLEIGMNGIVDFNNPDGDINTSLEYRFKSWPLKKIVGMVPQSFNSYIEGFDIDGMVSSHGSISGIYNDSLVPWLDISLLLEGVAIDHSSMPLPVSNIQGDFKILTDLADDSISYLRVNHLEGIISESGFRTKGVVKNLFSDLYCKFSTDADINLEQFNQVIPLDLNMKMKGRVKGSLISEFTLSQIENLQFEKMIFTGQLSAHDLDIVYDSLWLRSGSTDIRFSLPNQNSSDPKTQFVFADISTGSFETGKADVYSAFLKDAHIILEASDIRDTSRIADLVCYYRIDTLMAVMDTISIALKNPSGILSFAPGPLGSLQPEIKIAYSGEGMKAMMGKESVVINRLNLDTEVINDQSQSDIFLQWLVKGFIDLDDGLIVSSFIPYDVEIPAVRMDFEPERLDIKDSRVVIDKSDFELKGKFDNLLSYFRGDSILRGDFTFTSKTTDLLQLMNLTNGIGLEDGDQKQNGDLSADNADNSGPYMVPRGIDLLVSANIDRATFGVDTAFNIWGDLRVNDGLMLLDNITFSTSAARMQLTAMYRTPRKNHLFLGLDYHMLDIEIEELLNMIPDIDTLMPMLRSFRGKGEFHLAIESYLDSTYSIKKSTLRGASSIKGENLVLLDGETFSEIARTLRFNKRTENRVDSLSAEFTIFREEIDVYPFLIVMDRYRAVVGGRHNFDLSFDYHITVVDSPLPVRLGIDIKGNMDDFNYRLAPTRYAELYRPASRRIVENKQLELRRMIREALTQKVIE